MKSFIQVAAALTAIVVPTLAATTTSEADIIFTTQAASQDPDSGSLCPDYNGKNVTDNAGVRYAVSCNYIMTAAGEEEVGGTTSPLICMKACDENEGCYGVNMHLEGGCTLISGEQTGLRAAQGSLNLVRLGPAPVKSTSSRVQITKTVFVTASAPTSSVAISTTKSSVQSAPSTTHSSVCELRGTDLCPQCDNTIAVDYNNVAYTIFCDSSLYSNGTYSIQEWLSPAACLQACDELDFCEGANYYDGRSCELARGENVLPVGHAGYTAFLPVYTGAPIELPDPSSPSAYPTTAPKPTRFPSNVTNITTTSSAAEPTFSILPIDAGCNMSALTCPECSGAAYTDELNATYTVLCDFAPTCESRSNSDAASSQEACMQDCDQDATCLAVLFFPKAQSCTLCKQGIEGELGQGLDYIVLLADIDGDDDPATPMTTSSPATTRPATTRPASAGWSGYPINSTRGSSLYSNTTALPTATAAFSSTRRSIIDLPTPFPVPSGLPIGPVGPVIQQPASITANSSSATSTRDIASITSAASVSALPISAASCPGLAEGVFVDSTDFEFYKVLCDSILTAAHSRFTSASDFPACAAACTGDCDGVQFGYTTRCGLYTDISLFGPGEGWTVGFRLADATSTELPYSTAVETTTTAALVSVTSAPSNGTYTRATSPPVMTPAGPGGYKG